MELANYIQKIGDMTPNTLSLLTEIEDNTNHIALGMYEYPETFEELIKKIKTIWLKK
ncbi:MAG: hypothetical protein Unbinned6004contig1002_4 [Prokaryotic dsDNA virus sp.]|nr:MAG: hypothetical protein Unbinned6004contig1002_4 [Prokaryotic dsDNA virus sp.]|tara:strand:- start:4514 stop:4684 length:171 start_codon:yes stop_codon:yes gene_type:complete